MKVYFSFLLKKPKHSGISKVYLKKKFHQFKFSGESNKLWKTNSLGKKKLFKEFRKSINKLAGEKKLIR